MLISRPHPSRQISLTDGQGATFGDKARAVFRRISAAFVMDSQEWWDQPVDEFMRGKGSEGTDRSPK